MTSMLVNVLQPQAEMAMAAHRWLLRSGIRLRNGAAGGRGAVHRAYDATHGALLPPYPEITGYAVQFHLRWSGDAAELDMFAARESGEWLLSIQANDASPAAGAFPYAVDRSGAHGGFFTFDSAIVGHALLDLAAATGDERYRTAAEHAARWVLRQQHANGGFGAGVDGVWPVSWASDDNCLHGKLALFLGRMWQAEGAAAYRAGALALLRWLASLQRADGGIVTAYGSDYVFAHTHCYAVEGMLAGAVILGQQQYLENAARGAAFLAGVQCANGGVPRYVGRGALRYLKECNARLPYVRMLAPHLDVGATAQAVRIWTWVRALRGGFARNIERGLAWLAASQLRTSDVHLDGGFPASIDPLKPWRCREMQLYPWVGIFAADAVRLQTAVNVAADLY